jgi:hypothetical protein
LTGSYICSGRAAAALRDHRLSGAQRRANDTTATFAQKTRVVRRSRALGPTRSARNAGIESPQPKGDSP